MKSKMTYQNGHAILAFFNGSTEMHHTRFSGAFAHFGQKAKAMTIKAVMVFQPSLEEALNLSAPEGYVFAGIDEMTQTDQPAVVGFRSPARKWKQEKKTDARIGRAKWLLYRLSTGYDATFVPAGSDWGNSFASPRGAGARMAGATKVFEAANE